MNWGPVRTRRRAALAMALIEFCRKMGCRVMATTHYAELKLYAMRTQGVINASCEFDVQTPAAYKLLIGIPRKVQRLCHFPAAGSAGRNFEGSRRSGGQER